jgi:hypothetical protein
MNESPAHLITNREFIGFSLYSVGGRKRHECRFRLKSPIVPG